MALPDNDRGRPGEERPHMSIADDDHIVERCSRCKHPIRAEKSVEIGLGPICRREVAA